MREGLWSPLHTLRLVTPLQLVGEGTKRGRRKRGGGGGGGGGLPLTPPLDSQIISFSSAPPMPRKQRETGKEKHQEGARARRSSSSDHGHLLHSVPAQPGVRPPRTSAPVRRRRRRRTAGRLPAMNEEPHLGGRGQNAGHLHPERRFRRSFLASRACRMTDDAMRSPTRCSTDA
ncbi:hypothetical protein OJAV_G00053280 [Oryzias javanicus]|uniref:Uncharacterized protein n=1 Tax=Oryzias javanicus TaxID=123683 RepID=A0A437DA19_ORYJA|nr:hypothetical protein OJAV_G00053280 [Oryzias javanicus]